VLCAAATCFSSNAACLTGHTVEIMDIQNHALAALRATADDRPFDTKNATVFVIGHDDQHTTITEYPDVYIALGTLTSDTARIDDAIHGRPLLGATALGVLTCGWAAPIGDDETPPSCHPLRRRVRLAVIATGDLVTGAALEFQDDADHPIFDDGSASGGLRDALLEAMRAVLDYQAAFDRRPKND
jgi:hypothetical protein